MVRKSAITSLFAGSPVHPLQQHMEKVCECAGKLPEFFEAIAAQNYSVAETIQMEISRIEQEADRLKLDLRMNLPNSLFMPMPREQILDLVTQQDKIANKAKDIAGVMIGRHMQIPQPIAKLLVAFITCSVDAAEQAKKAINELDELVEAGFRGNEVDLVHELIQELNKIEHQSDKLEQQIRHELFEIEQQYPPIDMMFLYRIIDWSGELANISQRVGSRLQLLLVR